MQHTNPNLDYVPADALSEVRERLAIARDWMRDQGNRRFSDVPCDEGEYLEGFFLGTCVARGDAARILHSILQDLDRALGNEVEGKLD